MRLLPVVPVDAIAAGTLGCVERLVGASQERRPILARQSLGQSDAGGDRQRLVLDLDKAFLDRFTNADGATLGIIKCRAGHDHDELVSSQAGHHARLPRGFAEDPPQAPQYFVAGGMPIFVVERLEIVDVDHGQAETPAVAPGLADAAFQLFVERAPVGQERQGIGAGFRAMGLDFPGLLPQLPLRRGKPLLRRPVGIRQSNHGMDQRIRTGGLAGVDFALDVFDHVAVLADIGAHFADDRTEPGERLVNAATLPLGLQIPQTEVGSHFGEQFLVIEGLDNVIVRQGLVATHAVGRRPLARDQNYMHALAAVDGLDLPAGLVTVDAGHHDVQEHQLRFEHGNFRQTLLAVGGHLQRVFLPQDPAKNIDVRGIVINDQHSSLEIHGHAILGPVSTCHFLTGTPKPSILQRPVWFSTDDLSQRSVSTSLAGPFKSTAEAKDACLAPSRTRGAGRKTRDSL